MCSWSAVRSEETRRMREIRFTIDFVSCVPIGYAFMILDAVSGVDESDSGNANKVKLTKILRLVRLAKNLARIARLKKLKTLVEEYEDYFEPIMYVTHRLRRSLCSAGALDRLLYELNRLML